MPASFDRGALTEATCLILFSLGEPRHGYGLMQHITAVTKGRVKLGAGTLYGALNLLLEKGWITAAGGVNRKKLYQVTPAGRHAAQVEMTRLAELLAIGRDLLEMDCVIPHHIATP